MLTQAVVGVLEDWRSRFESDEVIHLRDVEEADLDNLFDEIAGQLGLPLLGYGSARVVFALDSERVLKVGYSRCGMQSNRREMAAAKILPPNVHAKFCGGSPDGLWIVQERATALGEVAYDEVARLRTEAEAAVPGGVCDAAPDNFGRLPDGRPVLVDIESLAPIGDVLHPGEQAAKRYAQG